MRNVFTVLMVGLLTLAGAGCGRLQSMVSPSSSVGPSTANIAANLSFCVAETNRYRATVGLAPLRQAQALEDFAATAAQSDHEAREAHLHFKRTNGAGIARAETEILWWRDHPVRDVVQGGLAQMWRVGPGGEHYDIMAGSYTETGCGIFVSGSEVTVAQDFR